MKIDLRTRLLAALALGVDDTVAIERDLLLDVCELLEVDENLLARVGLARSAFKIGGGRVADLPRASQLMIKLLDDIERRLRGKR